MSWSIKLAGIGDVKITLNESIQCDVKEIRELLDDHQKRI
jgi:hypothetical protein